MRKKRRTLAILCTNCRFFDSSGPDCRRRAPSPRYWNETTDDDENYNKPFWPSVNERDWCGEFEEAALSSIDKPIFAKV
jgi:hypothetical protein